MNKKFKLPLLAASAAVVLSSWIWVSLKKNNTPGKAPDFELADPAGKIVSLSDFKGKVVLLNFWATWCPYCREEMPALEAIYERRRGEGLVILGPSVDPQGRKVILPFLARSEITYPVLVADQKTVDAYHVWSLPVSFLIDTHGIVTRRYLGPIDAKTLENDILIELKRRNS